MQGAEAVRSSNYRPQKTTKEEEDKRTEIEAKYKNLQKIHETTKKIK